MTARTGGAREPPRQNAISPPARCSAGMGSVMTGLRGDGRNLSSGLRRAALHTQGRGMPHTQTGVALSVGSQTGMFLLSRKQRAIHGCSTAAAIGTQGLAQKDHFVDAYPGERAAPQSQNSVRASGPAGTARPFSHAPA